MVFHIGDITYANGYISQWDQFTQQVEEITSRVPYMVARSVLASSRLQRLQLERNPAEFIIPASFACLPFCLVTFSGNHERDWPNSGSFFNGTDSGGECGVVAETMYYTPTENRANYW
jgi:acid phosphatase type 7